MRAMGRAGFFISRSNGDHFIFENPSFGGCVPVPKHKPTIANGTFASICQRVKAITGEDLDI